MANVKKIKPITAYTITDRDGNLDWRWIAPYDYMAIADFLGQANDAHWEKYQNEGFKLVKVTISPFEKERRPNLVNKVIPSKRRLQEIE